MFNKLKLKTEQEDIDNILKYYKEGSILNEELYNQNLNLQREIEILMNEKEALDRDLKFLREKNNEFDKSKKDDVLERYTVVSHQTENTE